VCVLAYFAARVLMVPVETMMMAIPTVKRVPPRFMLIGFIAAHSWGEYMLDMVTFVIHTATVLGCHSWADLGTQR